MNLRPLVPNHISALRAVVRRILKNGQEQEVGNECFTKCAAIAAPSECMWATRCRFSGRECAGSSVRDLVMDAVTMAIWQRQPQPGLFHHSGPGSQYTSEDLHRLLAEHGIRRSMSGHGNCYDNLCVESFFATLKRYPAQELSLARPIGLIILQTATLSVLPFTPYNRVAFMAIQIGQQLGSLGNRQRRSGRSLSERETRSSKLKREVAIKILPD